MILQTDQILNARLCAVNIAKEQLQPGQDLIDEAEKIYQWLIKDDNASETK